MKDFFDSSLGGLLVFAALVLASALSSFLADMAWRQEMNSSAVWLGLFSALTGMVAVVAFIAVLSCE